IDLGGHPVIGTEGDYIDALLKVAPKGSVFVDATTSKTLYKRYVDLLEAGIGIVSSNRRSFAVPYAEYAAMHAAARENGAILRYETTVGAALPILESISRGTNSCDEVLSIEAVVSCTLNQILSEYQSGGESLASRVRKAAEAGLTEPDPRVDLGGQDALRKLLILAREAGVRLEEAQVEVTPAVPETVMQGSIGQFYEKLEAYEPTWAAHAREAAVQGFRQRFV
ncbi:MAG TPA: bifunctional aspartate kinase/homoserine dehydrogenase I, partial [Rikenellaceae bacterium]|nr:bifunctional aspartate kinase/homoserine dehydrogenase I [Rikenellaceae bacterium]